MKQEKLGLIIVVFILIVIQLLLPYIYKYLLNK